MGWVAKLKERWNVPTTGQVLMILLVFALTGTTVLIIKRPILRLINPDIQTSIGFSIAYYILILPVYNLILLVYGFLLGQFNFFWNFEKRMFSRMFGRKKKEAETTPQE